MPAYKITRYYYDEVQERDKFECIVLAPNDAHAINVARSVFPNDSPDYTVDTLIESYEIDVYNTAGELLS